MTNTLRDVPLSLASDGVTIVQPHVQADCKLSRSCGYVVARIEPAYAAYAQVIVDSINAAMPAKVTGRAIKPTEVSP